MENQRAELVYVTYVLIVTRARPDYTLSVYVRGAAAQ